MGKPVTMGLLFYPRGGSAQVARHLAAALDRKGWPVRLFTGSLGEPGRVANAATSAQLVGGCGALAGVAQPIV